MPKIPTFLVFSMPFWVVTDDTNSSQCGARIGNAGREGAAGGVIASCPNRAPQAAMLF